MTDVATTRTLPHPTDPELVVLLPEHDVTEPELSIVIPALDEELCIEEFVAWCHEGMAGAGVVVAPMGDTVRVLTGVELCDPDDAPDFRQLALAVENAGRMLPLGEQVGENWFGNRPSTPDSLPVLGPAPGYAGLFCAFGTGHFGITSGPPSARLVSRLITGQAAGLDPALYSPLRFHR